MPETITIAERPFQVPNPFAEGHVLTASQADALNQTFHENIRNNLAKKLKEVTDPTEAQKIVDEYANDYEFGVRGGGGGSRDPVMTEALSMAREIVKRQLQKKGHKISGEGAVTAKEITALAKQALDKHPEWVESARETVKRNKELAASFLQAETAEAAE